MPGLKSAIQQSKHFNLKNGGIKCVYDSWPLHMTVTPSYTCSCLYCLYNMTVHACIYKPYHRPGSAGGIQLPETCRQRESLTAAGRKTVRLTAITQMLMAILRHSQKQEIYSEEGTRETTTNPTQMSVPTIPYCPH